MVDVKPEETEAKTGKKKSSTVFKPGQSGNPTGRPKGSRNKTTIAIENLLDGDAEDIYKKATEMAKAGNEAMIKFCGDKILASRKSRTITIDLPEIITNEGISEAQNRIMMNVTSGEITPDEGMALSNILESRRKTIELIEFEKRLEALEAG